MDNIFRVYSRQFSRGGVALIAVVHRGFASVPLFSFFLLLPAQSPLSLLPFLLPSPFLLRISSSSSFLASTTGFVSFLFFIFFSYSSFLSRPLSARSFSRGAAVHRYTRRSNLRTAGATRTNARCARREGIRRIFVFAHSRANAHPSSCDPPTSGLCPSSFLGRTSNTRGTKVDHERDDARFESFGSSFFSFRARFRLLNFQRDIYFVSII